MERTARTSGALSVILFALAYGLSLALLRIWLLLGSGVVEGVPLWVGSLIRVPMYMVVGSLLAVLLFRVPMSRWLAWFIVALFVLINVLLLHYEAVIGELLGSEQLRYLNAPQHLESSLAFEASRVSIETVVICSLLAIAVRLLRGRLFRLRPRSAIAIIAGCIVFTIALQIAPSALGEPYRWAARHPLAWFVLAPERDAPYARSLDVSHYRAFQAYLGHDIPFAGGDPEHPLCAAEPRPSVAAPRPRDVIMIVLEGVGNDELNQKTPSGEWLMPNLRRAADDGFSATNFHAVGTQSAQALPALFAGQPAGTYDLTLWRTPLARFDGIPRQLTDHGFHTTYLHGGDLSFEQQRQFLKMVGFQEFIEFDPHDQEKAVGWGYPDHVMFARLRDWIRAREDAQADQPYMAVLATLSSHHPYDLPDRWRPQVVGQDLLSRFHDSLRYLDTAFGEFYDWYRTLRKQLDPLLIVVSDHASLSANTAAAASGGLLDFEIPLIIVGLKPEELDKVRARTDRLGSQFDLPSTIAGLLGLPPPNCDQGLDVLADSWPQDRVVYGVGGRRLNEIHAFTPISRVRLRVAEKTIAAIDYDAETAEARDEHLRAMSGFFDLLIPLGYHLYQSGAYAPASHLAGSEAASLPRVVRPVYVSHRGNIDGFLPFGTGNRLEAVQRAIAKGFEWVEVDIQITRDGVPVLVHDRKVEDGNGNRIGVDALTLSELRALPQLEDVATLEALLDAVGTKVNLCLEIKPQRTVAAGFRLSHEVARMVRERRRSNQIRDVIVDGFSFSMVSSVAEHCECTTALDMPFREEVSTEWLEAVSDAGIEWIYVHKDVATPEVIRAAHDRRLKVMVYTVNPEDLDVVERLADEPPDGYITDHWSLKELQL